MHEDQAALGSTEEQRPKKNRIKRGSFLATWLARKDHTGPKKLSLEMLSASGAAAEDVKLKRFSLPWHNVFDRIEGPELLPEQTPEKPQKSETEDKTEKLPDEIKNEAPEAVEKLPEMSDNAEVDDNKEAEDVPGAPTKGYRGELYVFHDDDDEVSSDQPIQPAFSAFSDGSDAASKRTFFQENLDEISRTSPDKEIKQILQDSAEAAEVDAPLERAYELRHEVKDDDSAATVHITPPPQHSNNPVPTAIDPAVAPFYMPDAPPLRLASPFGPPDRDYDYQPIPEVPAAPQPMALPEQTKMDVLPEPEPKTGAASVGSILSASPQYNQAPKVSEESEEPNSWTPANELSPWQKHGEPAAEYEYTSQTPEKVEKAPEPPKKEAPVLPDKPKTYAPIPPAPISPVSATMPPTYTNEPSVLGTPSSVNPYRRAVRRGFWGGVLTFIGIVIFYLR